MQELRLVAVSEDGTYLVLATAGRGTRFTLPVDDRLRAAVRGHFSRLGQFEIEVESPLRPKEIQARIRAGETAEEIAESAGIPVERVRWFEGPVLQEREYMAQQAQRVPVRRPGESAPGPPLGELVEERLNRGGVDIEDVEWDSWKCESSSWRVRLSFFEEGRPRAAEWLFDPRRRHLSPMDELAARLSDMEWEGDGEDSSDTVTPLVPRRPTMKVVSDPREVSPAQPLRPGPAPVPDPARRPAPLAPAPPAPPALGRPPAPPPHVAEPPSRPPAPAPEGEEPRETASASQTAQSEPEAPKAAPAGSAETAPEATPAAEPASAKPDPAPKAAPAAAATEAERPVAAAAVKPAPPRERSRQKPPVPPAAAAETPPAQPAVAARDVPAVPAAQQRQSAPRRRRPKGKRASVPSWDEIMFGARRPD
ncbi:MULTISPECIES: septation protein SepH [Thermomonospora]|uniref:DUF3071 domain-containing protein n=1 Tax=Thermomonospora curvata (strain ATCC 19995 / DSM 43183 / JCM 3096 / KCTC 9072 / NBRC 15933 / NCIMB 10081 / Henssen B9) TaxID=471852 RepID=D1ABZ6_THECD|nr:MULTISPECIES: septation protein SepH [Thermomonospora]ACY97262.1 hypothetical protein Tcur_1687 [Thermomonospora curvata DSM 43183]PKK14633.1 MAG: DUF3071 domain-containing protein [Thermomonospora sp. CIF 1]